jgi:hypothetical protein
MIDRPSSRPSGSAILARATAAAALLAAVLLPIGPGIGAKALIGGSRRSTVLQPVSVMGKVGANLALGVTGLTLRFEDR